MGRIRRVMATLIHGASPAAAARHTPPKDHNESDIRFVRAMITHHTQAIQMADMALQRAADERIVTLASNIKLARPRELQRLCAWLNKWGEELPAAPPGARDVRHSAHHLGTGAIIADADLHEVHACEGAAFERRWLHMMIQHHERAVDTAKTEQADGHNADATRLARQLESSHRRVVSHMQGCLKS